MTQRDQCHWKKNLLFLHFSREGGMPCRATGEAPRFWSGGRSRNEGKTWATAFIVLLVGRAGQGRVEQSKQLRTGWF